MTTTRPKKGEDLMKKLFIFAVVIAGLSGKVSAWFGDDSADRTGRIVYSTAPANATLSTTTILIDLSDTTNWPHKQTREINISSIRLEVDKLAASSGTVRIGVVTLSSSTAGFVSWFFIKDFKNNASNGDNDIFRIYAPNFIRTRVEGGTAGTEGTTPYLAVSPSAKTTASTVYQSDVALPTLLDTNVAPARGDIVFDFTKDVSSAWKFNIEIDYNTPNTQ